MVQKNGSQYVSPTGEVSNRALSLGEWYVAHKLQIRRIAIWILLIWCVVTIGFTFIMLGSYFLFGMTSDDLLARRQLMLPNYVATNLAIGAKPLQISDVHIFRSAGNVYTLSASVQNPNPQYASRVQYSFGYSGGETPISEAVILPGQSRDIAAFGVMSESYPSNTQLNIQRTDWRRIDTHRYPDIAGFMAARLMFSVSNFAFHSPDPAKGALFPGVGFDLSNDSAYSYWRPVFYVELLNGTDLVGLQYVSFDQLHAGEKRHVDLQLFGDSLNVTDMKLIPTMNVFDSSVFIAPGQ